MPVYAIGPVSNGTLTVEAAEDLPAARYIPTELTAGGKQSVEVPDAILTGLTGGRYGLAGRKLNVPTDGSAVSLLDRTLAERRPEWTGRVKAIYLNGMGLIEQWWPTRYAGLDSDKQQRSRDVLDVELPMWHSTNCAMVMAAVAGRSWPGMTAAQIEALVAHMENHVNGNVASRQPNLIEWWYRTGRDLDVATANGGTTLIDGRLFTMYASRTTLSAGYTDMFNLSGGVPVGREPDYNWNLLGGFSLPILGDVNSWDPENPS